MSSQTLTENTTLNAFLFTGYFPKKIEQAVIDFVPKPGKWSKKAEN